MEATTRKTLAKVRREAQLEMLRDGRRNRATQFRSNKDYRRRPKHRGQGWN